MMNKKEIMDLMKEIPAGKYFCDYRISKWDMKERRFVTINEEVSDLMNGNGTAEICFEYLRDRNGVIDKLLLQSSTYSGYLGVALTYHDLEPISNNIYGEFISFGSDNKGRKFLRATLGSFDMIIDLWNINVERPI